MLVYTLRYFIYWRHHKRAETILRYYIGYLYKAYALFWWTLLVSTYLFDNEHFDDQLAFMVNYISLNSMALIIDAIFLIFVYKKPEEEEQQQPAIRDLEKEPLVINL